MKKLIIILIFFQFTHFNLKAYELWAWGNNEWGQLGDGSYIHKNTPTLIGTANNWSLIAPGAIHAIAIKNDGTLWAWGDNDGGVLGDGTTIGKNTPTQIGTANNWSQISSNYFHSIAIKTDGTLWAWGSNDDGELGDGTNIGKKTPTQIGTANNWSQIATGSYYSIAIKTDGTLWAWGLNSSGQLGDGTNTNKNTPTKIGSATDWSKITCRNKQTFAIKTDGTLWAWGNNQYGQLGDGTYTNKNTPTIIGSANNWSQIACGYYHTIAIKTDGTLWAWGYNTDGQLGDGTNTDKNTPTKIGTSTNWSQISVGGSHTLAIKTDGSLWVWGSNNWGQLGDGTYTYKNTPTQIGTANNWSQISAGSAHTYGLKNLITTISTLLNTENLCVNEKINITYSTSNALNSGNTFTAQLSDASGSFASPVTIGTLTATSSGTINATLPANTSPGSAYRIRVISSNPAVTGSDNGSNISIFALPAPVITAQSSFCQKNIQTINANTENGMRYKWYVTEGTVIGCDTCATLNVQWLEKTSGSIKLVETNANGCKDSTNKMITLNPLPKPSITGLSIACSKSFSNFSIEKQNGHSYKWILTGNGAIQGSDIGNMVIVNWSDVGSASLKLIETIDATGCSDSLTKDIIVNELPKPDLDGNLNPCSTCLNTYNSNSPSLYNHLWEVEGGSIIGSMVAPSVLIKWYEEGSGTLKLIQINPNTDCRDSIIKNIVIATKPKVEITGQTVVCQNNQYTYTGVNEDSTKFEWFVRGGKIKNGINTNRIDVIWDSTGSQTIKQIKTISSKGFKDSITIDIFVNALPKTEFTGSETSLDGETKDYTTNVVNADFQWFVENGSFVGSSNTNSVKVKWGYIGLGTIKLISTDKQTKCKDSLSKKVNINSASGITITGKLTPCENETAQYSIDGNSGEEYLWSASNGSINGSVNSSKVEVIWTKSGQGTLTLIRTILANSKKDTVKLNVEINPLPNKPSISRNEKKLVSTSNTGNQWFLDNNLLKDSTNSVIYPNLKGNYQVQVTLMECSSEMSDVYSFDPTSVEEDNLKNSFKIVPNPAADFVEITILIETSKENTLQIFTNDGQLISDLSNNLSKANVKNIRFDTSNLPSGTYTVILTMGKTKLSQKLIIVK